MKPLHKLFSSRQLIPLGMLIPALLLAIVGGLQWESVRAYRTSRDWVTHTREVLLGLESLLSHVNDAETGEREYLLTHQENYLQPYAAAVTATHANFQNIRRLTLDNPVQQQNLDQLEPLLNARLQEFDQTVALEKSLDHAGAIKVVSSNTGEAATDRIHALLLQMHVEERGLLEQREATYQSMVQINSNLSLLLTAVGFGCVIGITLMLRRMDRMEEMIKICAWSKMIEYEGKWLSIEEYLTLRLHARITHGLSQVEAERMLKLLEHEKLKEAA